MTRSPMWRTYHPRALGLCESSIDHGARKFFAVTPVRPLGDGSPVPSPPEVERGNSAAGPGAGAFHPPERAGSVFIEPDQADPFGLPRPVIH